MQLRTHICEFNSKPNGHSKDISLPGRAKSNTQPQTASKEVILMTGFCDPGLQIGTYKTGTKINGSFISSISLFLMLFPRFLQLSDQ